MAAGLNGRWRSGWDSNPRYAFGVYSLSRRAPSTTRPPLRMHLEVEASRVRRFGGQACRSAMPTVGRRTMNLAERLLRRKPTADDVYAIARRTLQRLPSPFAESLGDIVLSVEDLADMETIRGVGLRHPMQLSGLYEGVPLNLRSVDQSGTLPERVTLYLAPILAEWSTGSDSIERLVAHIVIHEIGHHFGFSDDDMHDLEDAAE